MAAAAASLTCTERCKVLYVLLVQVTAQRLLVTPEVSSSSSS
jgi:hypothetical protein